MNHPKKILIAEDNIVLREVLRFNLERAGFTVASVPSGDAAAKILSEESFDVMLTDCDMPNISGIELCRIVREEHKNLAMRIVMCTARAMEMDSQELMRRFDLAGVLHKPFSMKQVIEVVSQEAQG